MKIKANTTKTTSVKTQRGGKVSLGSSSSSKPPSPLMPSKKGYKKAASSADFGQIDFGQTGLTGET